MANISSTLEIARNGVRNTPRGALPLLMALALALGCQGPPSAPKLTEEETLLVNELVALHRLQILQGTRPAAADSLRLTLQAALDGPGIEERIRLLAADPARGAVLLRAVRDSLAGRRGELFDPSGEEGGQPVPRTQETRPPTPVESEREK